MKNGREMTFGMIVGNRGFFPDHLAKEGREEMLKVLEGAGIHVIALSPEESKYGAIETHEEARRCGDLFRQHRDEIDGVIVTLPNFGDERAIADAHALFDVKGSRAGAGDAGQKLEDDDCVSSR